MSSTTGTRAPGGQAQPAAPVGKKEAGGLSLVSATALVIGSIIGTGVFTMPAVMAAGGTSSLAVLAVVGAGAMLLAACSGAFGWSDRSGNAWFGVVIAAVLPSLLMLWRYTSGTGLTVFTYLVDLTVVTVAIPYLFSACAQLTFLVSGRRPVHGWLLARDLTVAGASVLFSLWVNFTSGYQAVYQALVIVLLGVIIYAVLNGHRERAGQIPQPVDNPPDDGAQPPGSRPAPAGAD